MRKSMADTPQATDWDLIAAVTNALLVYSLADALGALAIVWQMVDTPAPTHWWSDLMLTIALSVQALGLAWMGTRLRGMRPARRPGRVGDAHEIA
nr:MAG TPA: hypothetical protein [Caudoviricetes sp.]